MLLLLIRNLIHFDPTSLETVQKMEFIMLRFSFIGGKEDWGSRRRQTRDTARERAFGQGGGGERRNPVDAPQSNHALSLHLYSSKREREQQKWKAFNTFDICLTNFLFIPEEKHERTHRNDGDKELMGHPVTPSRHARDAHKQNNTRPTHISYCSHQLLSFINSGESNTWNKKNV